MNVNKVKSWLLKFTQKIKANTTYLNELDTSIGDGDHGSNMTKGSIAIEEALEKDFNTVAEVYKAVGFAIMTKVGGASGALYGSAFVEMSKLAQNTDDLLVALEGGRDMISKRGRSERNEKTMLDIWYYATEHLKANTLTSKGLNEELLRTKALEATKGRASYLGKRSLGHTDPGSQSSVYLFESLLEVL